MHRGMAFLLVTLISLGLLGCGTREPDATGAAPSNSTGDLAKPDQTPAQPDQAPATPDTAPPPPPRTAPPPGVSRSGEDLEITLPKITNLIWSPSGRLAVVQTDTRNYLLEAEKPGLDPLPLDSGAISFWSETELLWTPRGPRGDLNLRDLTTGRDRLLHHSETPLLHLLKPGEQHLIYLLSTGAAQQGPFGKIYWTRLGEPGSTLLLENARFAGRMADGRIIATEAPAGGGPLWVLHPDGKKAQLSKETAHFPAVSPDGKRLLWFTGPAPQQKSSWLEWLKPAVAHASGPYDPPLTDLWVWEGSGEPKRFALGCTCSAHALFSPDSRRIALSINETFMEDGVGPKQDQVPKPGKIALVENGTMRDLAQYPDRTTVGIWLGNDGVQIRPVIREKTGGMPPLLRLTLDGKVADQAGMWFLHQDPWNGVQVSRWLAGDRWEIHWESGLTAALRIADNEHPTRGRSLQPGDPYAALIWEDRTILRKVEWK